MHLKTLLLSTIGAGAALYAAPALAQDGAGAAQERAEPAVQQPAASTSDEIVVMARKREESILKVPVIETVIGTEELDRVQAINLPSITARVPGILIGAGTLSVGSQVSIRGVGTSSLDSGVDQSVSLNIDGLQFSQGLAYKVGLFDLAQAEILKGPQALFFGKNSPGGVIALRTADPTSETEIVARTGYELEAGETRSELIVSGPLSPTLGVRLAGMYDYTEGFFRNRAVALPGLGGVTPDRSFANAESYILRGTAVWKPGSDFDARLKVNYAHDRTDDGGIQQLVSCPDGVGGPAGIPFLSPQDDCRLNRDMWVVDSDPAAFPGIRNNGRTFSEQKQLFGTLEMNYRLAPEVTLTSVTGYYDVRQDSMINGTATGASGAALNADNHFERHDFTQELRLNTDLSGPINLTAGSFYQKGTLSNRIWVMGNTFLGLPATLQLGSHKVEIESWSAFGQLRWRPAETLELAGGVRYTDEHRSDVEIDRISGTAVIVPLATPRISSGNFSPELTATYTPTDDLTLFGSVKRGYKSGSFSITTMAPPGNDNSFGDEQVEGGELGLKSRWFDRSLTINLAGYHYFYKGLQVGANEPPEGGVGPIVLRTINAGAARVYGIDFDIGYRPPDVPGLALHAALNWNRARFKRLEGIPCYGGQTIAQGCNQLFDTATGAFTSQNRSGQALVRAPDWQVNFGFDYDIAVGGGKKVVLSSSNQYSSRYLTNLLGRSDFYQPAFFKTGLTVSVGREDNGWELALIGNNLTNRITTANCINGNFANGQILGGQNTGTATIGAAGGDELLCFADRGREIWMRLTLRPALLRNGM